LIHLLQNYKKLRIVIVSDTHNYAHSIPIPPADILIHAGDFTVNGSKEEVIQFTKWLDSLDYIKHKLVVPGNHEHKPNILPKLLEGHCTYLSNQMVEIEGFSIYGSSWKTSWKQIPYCDILVTHRPPMGHLDIIYDGSSVGNDELRDRVYDIKPILHICGHNHEGYGEDSNEWTKFIGGANCCGGSKSTMRRKSIVIDLYPELKDKYH